VEVDGVVHEGHAATVLVANCGQIVPGLLPLGAHIRPDDGVLDVVVIDATSYAAALRVTWRLFQRCPHQDAGITFYRGSSVRVATEPSMPVQSDGDALGATPLRVDLVPGALAVYAPVPRRLVWGMGAT
jgi:diacylglycerol kinase (ATP)